MLNGMQLVTIPIDHKWKPFAVLARIREIIASQNSTHVFIGAWAVSTAQIDTVQATFMVYADAAQLMMQGYPGSVLEAVATMGSSYGFPVVDAVGRSIELSNEQKYPALCRVVC